MANLKANGILCEITSKKLGIITSSDGHQLEVGKNYITTGSIKYDAVYVAGGQQSVDSLMVQGDSLHFVNEAFKHAKAIGAANEGVNLLRVSDIKEVVMASVATQTQVVTELGIVTINNAGDMRIFSEEFIKAISQHRHWYRQNKKDMVSA